MCSTRVRTAVAAPGARAAAATRRAGVFGYRSVECYLTDVKVIPDSVRRRCSLEVGTECCYPPHRCTYRSEAERRQLCERRKFFTHLTTNSRTRRSPRSSRQASAAYDGGYRRSGA